MIIYQTTGIFDINLCYVSSFTTDPEVLKKIITFFKHHRLNPQSYLLANNTDDLSIAYDFDKKITMVEEIVSPNIDLLVLLPEPMLSQTIGKLKQTTQPNNVWVNLDAVTHNYNYFQNLCGPDAQALPVIKANAQGAGLVHMAKHLETLQTPAQIVAFTDEGVRLRTNGIKSDIIVLRPYVTSLALLVANRLEPLISSIADLNTLLELVIASGLVDYPIHIQVETGFNVMGFTKAELVELTELLNNNTHYLRVKTILSHLSSSSDQTNKQVSINQAEAFEGIRIFFNKHLKQSPSYQLLDTGGTVNFPEYRYQYCRFGKALLGYVVGNEAMTEALQSVVTLTSVLAYTSDITAGTAVGYGQAFVADKAMTIGTIPIGFADFFCRKWGEKGTVSFNGQKAKIIGHIRMDALTVDLTDIDYTVGQTVEIIGSNIHIIDMAKTLGTIPSEILCGIAEQRVNRIYYAKIT